MLSKSEREKIEKEFKKRFVENGNIIIANLNNELYVNGKEKDVLDFIFQQIENVLRGRVREIEKKLPPDTNEDQKNNFVNGLEAGLKISIEILKK